LQGNGNDIWGTNDEGFYAYTSKPSDESWLLTGKIVWVETGGNEWAKFGPMIRVDADNSGSPNAFLLNKGLQNFMRAAQRPASGADTNDGGDLYDSTGATAYSGNEVWMRMGYYAPLNMVYGEISLDGSTWHHVLTTSFDFGDNVNYGFAITNHDGNDVLAIGEVSDVSFEQLTSAPSILGSGAGEFDYNVDVGLRHLPGESSYDASSDTYTVTGSGPDIWDNNDGFQYLFKEMTGAFEAEAEMYITAPGDGEWTKGGMMVRADLGSAAPHGFAMQQTDGDSQIEIRINPGDNTSDQGLQPYGDTTSRYRIVKIGSAVQYYYEDLSGN
ncbi:hypothetical protein K8I31_17650, partial [bacterium]|nr:hypothetical protein [bacterium]